jgi:hypothetical protein
VHIDWLDKRLARLDAELEHFISNNPVWKDLSELLCSAPGIGPVVTGGSIDFHSAMPENRGVAAGVAVAIAAAKNAIG